MKKNTSFVLFLLHNLSFSQNKNNINCLNNVIENFAEFGETVIQNFSPNFGTLFPKNNVLFVSLNYLKLENSDLVKTGKQIFVLEIKSVEEIKTVFSKLKTLKFWNSRSKFLILIPERSVNKPEQIFQLLWSFNVYKIIIFVNRHDSPVIFFWYPYYSNLTKISNCRIPQNLSKKHTFKIGQVPSVFTPKPLKTQIVIFPPYVLSPNTGSDISIIAELSKILKCEYLTSRSRIPYDFGTSFPNKTVTGMVAEVYHQRVDLAIGGFILQPDRFELLDSSYPYFNEVYFWCVPKSRKTTSWREIFTTLRPETWFLIFLTLLTLTTILWLFSLVKNEKIQKFQIWVFINFAILVGSSGKISPRGTSIRFFFLFWTMICLILNIIYQTEFISLMQKGIEEHQIATMEELLVSNLEIQMKHSTHTLFGDSKPLQKFIKKGYTKCKIPADCIRKVAFERNSAFFASSSFVDFFKNRLFDSSDSQMIYCFDGGISFSPIFLAMRQDFILRDFINEILRRFQEGGLIDFWRKQTFLKRKWITEGESFKKMNFRFFQAPLFCWIIGICVSGFVFVTEILINNFLQEKNSKKCVLS